MPQRARVVSALKGNVLHCGKKLTIPKSLVSGPKSQPTFLYLWRIIMLRCTLKDVQYGLGAFNIYSIDKHPSGSAHFFRCFLQKRSPRGKFSGNFGDASILLNNLAYFFNLPFTQTPPLLSTSSLSFLIFFPSSKKVLLTRSLAFRDTLK
uniref:Uncharacterized protein n=1 Tax=Parascaris univalens TaxID=6257 RepID=A0A915BLL1_PARUN